MMTTFDESRWAESDLALRRFMWILGYPAPVKPRGKSYPHQTSMRAGEFTLNPTRNVEEPFFRTLGLVCKPV